MHGVAHEKLPRVVLTSQKKEFLNLISLGTMQLLMFTITKSTELCTALQHTVLLLGMQQGNVPYLLNCNVTAIVMWGMIFQCVQEEKNRISVFDYPARVDFR
uniref:Uncharacterized protein n=1 Tax=Rhipicephalus zambeziensis TaxID=60191 RepID=A0A224Y527_9ACAR